MRLLAIFSGLALTACATGAVERTEANAHLFDPLPFNENSLTTGQVAERLTLLEDKKIVDCQATMEEFVTPPAGGDLSYSVSEPIRRSRIFNDVPNKNQLKFQRMAFAAEAYDLAFRMKNEKDIGFGEGMGRLGRDAGRMLKDTFLLRNTITQDRKRIDACLEPVISTLNAADLQLPSSQEGSE